MSSYLGIPQEEWDSLAAQAEDIMLEKGYGQHILGTYPAGPRIFGSANAEPQLYVITVDDPLRRFDPFVIAQQHFEEDPFLFIDLHTWARNLEAGVYELGGVSCGLPHIIPTLGPAHYEDPQLTEIMYLAEAYLRARGWDDVLELPCGLRQATFLRTRYILAITGRFAPCLNREWDTVESISDYSEHDKLLIKHIAAGQSLDGKQKDDILDYCHALYEELLKHSKWEDAKKEEKLLGEAVKRFYTQLM